MNNNMLPNKILTYLFIVVFTLPIFSQVTVTNRTFPNGDFSQMKLDHTIVVEYSIHTNSTLHNVLPELTPPDCANSNGVPFINCTTDLSTSIATMNGGSTQIVRFYIHLFEEAEICGDTNPFCTNGDLYFDLNIHSSEGTFPATDTGSYLQYSSPENDILALDFVCSERVTPVLATSLMSGFPIENTYNLSTSGYDVQDPNTRVFLYMDWQTNTTTPWAHVFFYGLTDGCSQAFLPALQSGEIELFDGIAEDRTSPNPDNWHFIDQAPVGGGGSVVDTTKGIGVNLFDISDLNSNCSDSVRNHLDYSVSTTYQINFWVPDNTMFREIKIMLGHLSSCVSDAPIFLAGPSNSDFKIKDITISSNGDTSASLEVPTSWKSGQTLSSNYSVEWYLKSPTQMYYLGNSGQQLSIDASTGHDISNFSEYSIESRVIYDDSTYMGVVFSIFKRSLFVSDSMSIF